MKQSLPQSKMMTWRIGAAILLLFAVNSPSAAQISLTTSTPSYTQNFNSFDGTAATAATELTGWTLSPNTYKGTGCGTATAGGIYAFGVSGSGDYSLGYQPASGSPNDTFYAVAHFVNNSGYPIESVTISYNFERWRPNSRLNGFVVTSNLGDVSALNQAGAGESGTACTVMTTAKTVTLSGLNIIDGDTFYVAFRGGRGPGTGASQGIAIDDFSVTALVSGAPYLSVDTLSSFSSVCVGDTSAVQSVTVNGNNLTGPVTVTAPAGFLLGNSAAGPFSGTLTLTPSGGSLSQNIFVLFAPTSGMSYSSQITLATSGIAGVHLDVQGTGNAVNPSLVIDLDHDLNICEGTVLTFTASDTDGGILPAITWLVNGVPNGVTTGTFVTSTLDSGDVVSATMISSASCAADTAVTSNSITVAIYQIVIPTISITATPVMPVPSGDPVTFNSNVTGVGMSPTFVWLVNGDSVDNGPAYTSDTLSDGDIVQAILYTDAPCATLDSALSNEIVVMLGTGINGLHKTTFTVSPNPAQDMIQVKGYPGENYNTATLQLLNTLGQQVYFSEIPLHNGQLNTQINTQNLPAGIYILRVESGAVREQLRMVIRK